MTKVQIGWLLVACGLIPFVIGMVKLSVIGYYPSELPLYLILLAVGGGLMWAGHRSYRSGKMSGQ